MYKFAHYVFLFIDIVRVKMHTLLVVLSIMGGLKLFGILGIIYGPLVVTAFLTLTDIYHVSYQKLVDPVED